MSHLCAVFAAASLSFSSFATTISGGLLLASIAFRAVLRA
jgi:hypothetical protein